MHQVKYNKTQIILNATSYMFRHHSAVLGEFNNNKVS